ncbi:segregation/condensation protein A [Streptomyces sp. DW26H14]|uniref:segregation/condensation protein A n=1 Tax=Streptomyces sp. DW26H14 TaxID=3435395 RepID=UPI00403DFB2F
MPPTNPPRRPLGQGPGAARRPAVPAGPAHDAPSPSEGPPERRPPDAGPGPVRTAPGTGADGSGSVEGPDGADRGASDAPSGDGQGRPGTVAPPAAPSETPEAPSERLPDAGTAPGTTEASEGAGEASDGVFEALPAGAPDGAARPAPPADTDTGAGAEAGEPDDGRFTVRLVNFEGPFDLLLQLISKHKLDVTEVALSTVTDEFMAHIRAMGPDWDLDQTTEFLVVAATLLDLKAARLLPAAEVEDEADLALLEARDLLFARLLQYRAYKEVAAVFAGRLDAEARRYPRTVGLEPGLAELLPDVVIRIGPEGFARLAVKAMQPKPEPQVYVDHIHAPLVSVQEQARLVVALLRERGRATFQELTDDTDDTLTVVARFLALLELYRARAVGLDQEEALGALVVHWTGGQDAENLRVGEFDLVSGTGEPEEATA